MEGICRNPVFTLIFTLYLQSSPPDSMRSLTALQSTFRMTPSWAFHCRHRSNTYCHWHVGILFSCRISSVHALAGNGSVSLVRCSVRLLTGATPHITVMHYCNWVWPDQYMHSSSLWTSVNISDVSLDSDIQHHLALALAVSLCVCLTLKTCSNCISAVSERSSWSW